MIRPGPMLVPPEAFVILAVAVALVVAVAVVEVIVFIRGAAATRLPARFLGLIAVGIALGLAHSALELFDPALADVGFTVAGGVIVAVLILTVAVAVQLSRNPLLVALLGAGLLYQLGWAGGRFVLPDMPIIGDAVADARCQRDPDCRWPSLISTGQAQLHISAPDSDTTFSGEATCIVNPRPDVTTKFSNLDGALHDDAGRVLNISVEVLSPYDGPGGIYFLLDGALGDFSYISGEAYVATKSLPGPGSVSAHEGTITFDRMLMESLRPGDDLPTEEHEFDQAHGTLTWTCD